ncbi:HEAT repeat protein-like protein [Lineolata rhizophorae]|uniref:HEAT repeat protein-like protein n=1 Tax=Lineolata rhizophorae TaxID=578093 RepID=A0A6A6NSV7_9PEZI|nr:HEAT repeat protein-like protein [Lineolata rhizophorae]
MEASNAANGDTSDAPELDVPKLHSLPSEQQDLYLLTFSADLARHVDSLDRDGASAHQIYVKKQVFQILGLSNPLPTRAIRNNLGRSLSGILGKGDRKLLFETINELIAILSGPGKAEKDVRVKHAAMHCLGAVFEAAGDSAIGLSSLACSTILRALKTLGHNHTGLRAGIFTALARVYKTVAASADEAVARDVCKQARSAASTDRSLLVQARACACLQQLAARTPFFDNSNDFEKLQAAVWKAIDSGSSTVRHAAAGALSAALVKSYSEIPNSQPIPRLRKPKKSKKAPKGGADDDEDSVAPERPGSPAPTKPVTQLSYSLPDLLKQLSSHYCRPVTSNRARAGIAVCYVKTITSLGESIASTKYSEIARHLLVDLLCSSSIVHNRYRQLTTRRYVRIILENVVGQQMLGEAGQIGAAKYLINDILKDYPQALKERPEPAKQTLTGTLSTLSSLISSLGSATSSIADLCREGLLQVLQHPSYTVQVHASACLRSFVLACPQQLLPCVTICMNSVNRELGQLAGPRQSPRRCVGWANGLAAVLSTSNLQPLYGSVEINSRVLSQATNLLKSSSSSDLRISSTQIQVAWILIGGLMSLGPNFVKIHLSQLLLLWKNALPKPLNKDNMGHRNMLELSFLAHVRECALGSILAFLSCNSRLLTVDVTKRLAAMLQNTALFLNSLPARKTTEDIGFRLSPSLQLQDFDLMVRRRVLQCYTKLINLSPAGSAEALLQSNVLPLALSSFADPDSYAPSSLSSSIATSAGTFESIWDVADNCGFGVTGMVQGLDFRTLEGEGGAAVIRHWTTRKGPQAKIDRTLLSPICGSREHDSLRLYVNELADSEELPDPPSTEVVNAAINLFAVTLPLQAVKVQESILEQMVSFLSANSLQRDPARKAAMTVNIAAALLSTMKVAVKETRSSPGDLKAPPVEKAIQELLRSFVVDNDPFVRNVASEALGRLCSGAGNTFTTAEVNFLVDQIVSNREPQARSGYAVALGSIHSQLGGMAAGFHLKNILSILMSLSSDPHPTVHFWALDSLSRVAESAGLSFSGYVSSTLGILSQLYMSDSHNEESVAQTASNLEVDQPTPAVIARCIDSLINVLGPDLQDMAKPRDLIMTLLGQFQHETEELVLIESLRCLEHLSLYAPGHMEYAAYVKRLQKDLTSANSAKIRKMALDGLHNLMRRDAPDILRTAQPGLEDALWFALNTDPNNDVVQNIFRNWLHQTGLTATLDWVQRCHTALTRTTSNQDQAPTTAQQTKQTGGADLQDEEVAGFATSVAGGGPGAGAGAEDESTSTLEMLKWQVRTFAMDLLSDLLSIAAKDAGVKDDSPAEKALQQRVADVVRVAFSASTAGVVELRLRGLRIIDQVLRLFGKTPDPDFVEASLLEQYQAQIGSALTPAFAADSSPELAAQAVSVCATFIATGIVTDVDRMGRILKLLVSALENFSSNTEMAAIGDLKGLSSNAQVMVKMSVFSAWAELQIASAEQKYLTDVLKPHVAKLTPLWLSSLREFARLRFEPDISMSAGPASLTGSLDTIYAALNRETLLKFYQDSWLKLVDAIASLIDEDSDFVFDALDGRTAADESASPEGTTRRPNDINYRDEPVAFFFVLFGLAFEALAGRSGENQANQEHTLEILQALKKILRPSVSGYAIYQEVIFSETMDMLDRLVLTEPLAVQAVIVEIARNLCLGHPSARNTQDPVVGEEKLSEDIDQLFELTRIVVLVIAGLVPTLNGENALARHELNDESVALLSLSLSSLVDAAAVFPSIIKTDLHACILHIFSTIISTGSCQATAVPQALPIFRRFVASLARSSSSPSSSPSSSSPGGTGDDAASATQTQLRATLTQLLATIRTAQRRETPAALPCEKHAIMASTMLLSAAAPRLAARDPLLERFVAQLADCLASRTTAKVAAGCARTLLLLPPPPPSSEEEVEEEEEGSPASAAAAGATAETALPALLLPRLCAFVAHRAGAASSEGGDDEDDDDDDDPDDPDTAEARALLAQGLVAWVAGLRGAEGAPQRQRRLAAAMGVAVPTLLERARARGRGRGARAAGVRRETARWVLEVAAADKGAFARVVGGLGEAERAFLEEVVREVGGGGGSGQRQGQRGEEGRGDGGEAAPRIALRMDFG